MRTRLALAAAVLACAAGCGEAPRRAAPVGTWRDVEPMPPPVRSAFVAAVLPSGRVLVVGGEPFAMPVRHTARHRPSSPPPVFDPASGQWSQLSRFAGIVGAYDAVSLPDGRVLVQAQWDRLWTFEEAAARWSLQQSPPFSARLLAVPVSGKVLGFAVVGDSPTPVVSFDPSIGSWTAAASPGWSLAGAVFAVLPSGRVLALGGTASLGPSRLAAEYDSAADAWQYVAPAMLEKFEPGAVALEDGRVAVLGTPRVAGDRTVLMELYDPVTRTWTQAPELPLPVAARAEGGVLGFPFGSRLMVARAGRYVLVARAAAEIDEPPFAALFDPRTAQWFQVEPPRQRDVGKLLTLPSGEVLLLGGRCFECPGGVGGAQIFRVEEQ
ncbi:MAG: hypothetical protein HY906_04770 [Deltaproteobacteria bacterium]|nr:hypothetical protein [Deltaproteobacteria bacterium]